MQLPDLGLTGHETMVYKSLLESGPSLAGEITERTGIHRRNVYDCLERLIQKGLVGYIKENNRKRYAVTDPRKILERLKERETEWVRVMPELIAKFDARNDESTTLFFRGTNGLRQILQDQIDVGEEILVNATTTDVSNVLKHFFPKYGLLRKEAKIRTRMIFDEAYRSSKAKITSIPLCQARFIAEFNRSPMSQYIYGHNVAIVVWSEKPFAILIRQREVAQGFRDSFEVMWKMAKR